jgi:hypothetical protein
VDTGKVSVMRRIFMSNTIVARVVGGRKDSVVSPLKNNPSRGGEDRVPPR